MNLIRYILNYKKAIICSEQMLWKKSVFRNHITEECKLSKYLFIERTIDFNGSEIKSICLRCSFMLLQKKKRTIKRLGIEKKHISTLLKQHDIHYQEYGDNEHRVFLLNSGINVYFHRHHQLPIYIVQRVELSSEEDRAFILKIFSADRER